MTTIPQAAIDAAVQKLLLGHDDHPDQLQPWVTEECRKITLEVLTAALPLLGEQGTEYGVRVTNQTGLTFTYGPYGDIEVADAQMREVKPEWKPQIISRPAWHGEWTEVPGE